MSHVVHRALAAVSRRRELSAAWRRLDREDRVQFLRLAMLVPAIAVALRALGFLRTQQALSSAAGRRPLQVASQVDAWLARALGRARAHAPYPGNCLSQSMALWYELRRHGRPADLCLGARIDEGRFSAHAWVECEGRVVNDHSRVREDFLPILAPPTVAGPN